MRGTHALVVRTALGLSALALSASGCASAFPRAPTPVHAPLFARTNGRTSAATRGPGVEAPYAALTADVEAARASAAPRRVTPTNYWPAAVVSGFCFAAGTAFTVAGPVNYYLYDYRSDSPTMEGLGRAVYYSATAAACYGCGGIAGLGVDDKVERGKPGWWASTALGVLNAVGFVLVGVAFVLTFGLFLVVGLPASCA